jgi:hypothetical protein
MATRIRYKRRGLILVLMALLALLGLALRRPPPATASAIVMRFVGYTNVPNNDLRFALFSISNQAFYAIHWRGDWVEVEGHPEQKGRTINRSLPGYTYAPVLKSGESLMVAVGEPFDATESGRWRFSTTFSRYTVEERWFEICRTSH